VSRASATVIELHPRRRAGDAGPERPGRARDDELARALSGGHLDALEELYSRYRVACVAVARHVLDDIDQAEAVAQEVFLDLWAAPARYDKARSSFRQYLLTKTKDRSLGAARADVARRARAERQSLTLRRLPSYSSRCTRPGEKAGMHTETYSVASCGVE
jgi:DNA-directed RNA polymerase specialized sigma24 family protein